jgi:hypothetical protein
VSGDSSRIFVSPLAIEQLSEFAEHECTEHGLGADRAQLASHGPAHLELGFHEAALPVEGIGQRGMHQAARQFDQILIHGCTFHPEPVLIVDHVAFDCRHAFAQVILRFDRFALREQQGGTPVAQVHENSVNPALPILPVVGPGALE